MAERTSQGGAGSRVADLIGAIDDLRDAVGSFENKLRVNRLVQWVLGAVCVLLLGMAIVLSVTVVKLMDVVDDVKQSQVAGCESGNEFRGDIIDFVNERDLNYTDALAETTNASPDMIDRFLNNLGERQRIPESFLPRDCESLYG